MVKPNRILLLGAAVLLAGIGCWLHFESREADTSDAREAHVASEARSARSPSLGDPEPEGDPLDSIAARDPAEVRVAGSDPPQEPEPAAPEEHAGPGRLRVRAIDAETKLPVERIRVRAMTGTRFADRQSDRDGEGVELKLTPGTYSVLVMAKAYESTDLPAQPIAAGRTTTLGSVPMHRGSAKILGMVTGDTWPAGTLWVELVGEGRRPCPSCTDVPASGGRRPASHDGRWSSEDFCSQCGYAANASRLAVPPNGRFVFDRLTSGRYAVRLIDAGERTLCEPKFLALEAGQSLRLEIRFGAPRAIRVEIFDTDGASLARKWAARLRREEAADEDVPLETLHEEASNPPPDFQCEFRTERLQVGFSSFKPPPPDPRAVVFYGAASFGSRKLGAAARARKASDDRPREKQDELRPELPPANVPPCWFPSIVEPDGLVRFESVPALPLTLTMTSGPFVSTIEIPISGVEDRLQATLHATQGPKDHEAEVASTDARTFREYELQRMH